jgi:protein phosphatase
MRAVERAPERGGNNFVRPRRVSWQLADALALDVHGMSAAGPVRPANEDAFLITDVAPARHGHLLGGPVPFLAVADGVGGHAGGARASMLVVRTAALETVRRSRAHEWGHRRSLAAVEASLTHVVHACRDAIANCGAEDHQLAQMATTLTAGLIRGRTLHVAHVGDSRCYLSRRGSLTQVTGDQTMAHSLEESGVSPLPATSSLHHVLTNVLAANRESVEVETHRLELEPDDTLLFCTDGLSAALSGDAILATLNSARSASWACRELVRRALEADGSDNVTVVVGRLAHDTP